MTREFVIMPEFERQWENLGLSDDELRQLQEVLLKNPKVGVVIRGTKGLRKLRIAFQGKGKSGSGRVVYVDFAVHEVIYLVTAYPKSVKDNLTKAERNAIANMIVQLERGLKKQEKKK
ncbi:MAG: type II toxin-antitoxin system RelE/ParE family toxin [Treponema sp.]|nr:type II toxin-antitoxin system RelE/ParE family toxin [Treponema sp.]